MVWGDAESTIAPDCQHSDSKQFSFLPTFVFCSSIDFWVAGSWTWFYNNTLYSSIFLYFGASNCVYSDGKKCMLIVIHVGKAEKSILLGRKEIFLISISTSTSCLSLSSPSQPPSKQLPTHIHPIKSHFHHFLFFQLLSYVRLFATPWTAALQVSLSFNICQSLQRFMTITSMLKTQSQSSPFLRHNWHKALYLFQR